VLPRWGGSDHHIPGLKLPEEQQGMVMEWITRQAMKIEHSEGHAGLPLRIRKYPPHAAFDDRCHTTMQAWITIEQPL
jgi:hypothetical protein